MANQQQFEGPVLDELLERVRAEVGADARIVAANRVRKGGIAGFFSKQAYEVVVEPVDGSLDRALRQERARREAMFIPPPRANGEPGRAPTILDLAEAVSDDERDDVIDLVDEHIVSTQSRDFAQILDRFSRSIDPTPDELHDEMSDSLRQELRDGLLEARPPVLPDAVLDALPNAAPDALFDELTVETHPPAPLPNEPTEATRHAIADDDYIAITARHPGASSSRARTRRVPPTNAVIDRYETRLSQLGLPARLIPRGVPQSELKGALVESLIRLPAAPTIPTGLGVVIVIVGANAAPVLMARDLAAELDLDPDDVVLATREALGGGIPAWLQMNEPGTAHARRRSWQRRDRPTIVAVSLPPMYQSARWAREMLDNLEPTLAWAIVDAGWKREDIAQRIDAIGGVDALVLDHLDDTLSPATALEVGIPVGRLGQEHASPVTWAELLLERLADDHVTPE